MAHRASDTYSTIESSVVTEVAALLADTIHLNVHIPLIIELYEWQEVCANLPRVAYLAARQNGFKLDVSGEFFERKPDQILGLMELEVKTGPIRERVRAIIFNLDPGGMLQQARGAA
ncbi:hypothetical protein GVY41_18985 [Frigidibacter albus]|uniref:Uncharacterized protein n=1 Tax=Frigidibacter albus TaxID=1465486 RepID=A0A6L8VMY0_9RHOB|nr:hypothetical protein [Frigidibacter albus]MZQ91161.1 hypothetical protein [Frigidibacter albus]NBE33087.1 hypothetical protein [Frigidibacter albus]GGH63155.1 hypothetical protein GCM10011341_38030 [Frigidibacter albus]